MLSIDPKILMYIGGVAAAILSFVGVYFKGKRRGESKVTSELLKSDHELLTDLISNKEKVRRDGFKKENALNNITWTDIIRLRKKDKRTLQQITDAIVRGDDD